MVFKYHRQQFYLLLLMAAASNNTNQEEREKLVNVIRGVHENLRKSLFLTGDLDKVWNEHITQEDVRKQYACAMVKLATEMWKEKESRIHWTHKTCVDYFLNGGIVNSMLRELKIKHNWSPSQTEELKKLQLLSQKENNYRNLNRKLKLLDVGSCYNPFSNFPNYSCVAIDLTPATEDVIQCDFLKLKVKYPLNDSILYDGSENFIAENFDIVVFSLVLEYLPAKEQRIEFCSKAWELLKRNGLLIIITPDSKSLQHNAPMIKSWKICLQQIGFIRIKYEKLTHLHCMAFRKVSKTSDIDHSSVSKLMYIPQDFKKYKLQDFVERTENEDYDIHQNFTELPNECLF